jgi:RNA polymerase sigma-70 factor (ECF subfamily)
MLDSVVEKRFTAENAESAEAEKGMTEARNRPSNEGISLRGSRRGDYDAIAFIPFGCGPLMEQTPSSLLQRLRRPGDSAAWDRFVELYTPLLYYWARRVGLRTEDAADLVQDVFVLLVHKLPEFEYDRRKSFRAWLRTVTLNKFREGRRRRPPAAEGNGALDHLAGPDTAEALWEDEYRQHLAEHALKLMQADFQPATWKACWEYVVNGRPAAEVAAELGLSVGAVHAARFRILTRLRQELQGLLD